MRKEVDYMTHREWIKSQFEVLAETENSVFFLAYGEPCCEIGSQAFDCKSVAEFWELVEFFGDGSAVEDDGL